MWARSPTEYIGHQCRSVFDKFWNKTVHIVVSTHFCFLVHKMKPTLTSNRDPSGYDYVTCKDQSTGISVLSCDQMSKRDCSADWLVGSDRSISRPWRRCVCWHALSVDAAEPRHDRISSHELRHSSCDELKTCWCPIHRLLLECCNEFRLHILVSISSHRLLRRCLQCEQTWVYRCQSCVPLQIRACQHVCLHCAKLLSLCRVCSVWMQRLSSSETLPTLLIFALFTNITSVRPFCVKILGPLSVIGQHLYFLGTSLS